MQLIQRQKEEGERERRKEISLQLNFDIYRARDRQTTYKINNNVINQLGTCFAVTDEI